MKEHSTQSQLAAAKEAYQCLLDEAVQLHHRRKDIARSVRLVIGSKLQEHRQTVINLMGTMHAMGEEDHFLSRTYEHHRVLTMGWELRNGTSKSRRRSMTERRAGFHAHLQNLTLETREILRFLTAYPDIRGTLKEALVTVRDSLSTLVVEVRGVRAEDYDSAFGDATAVIEQLSAGSNGSDIPVRRRQRGAEARIGESATNNNVRYIDWGK